MAKTIQKGKEKRQPVIILRHEDQAAGNISRTLNVSTSAIIKTIKHSDDSQEDSPWKGRPTVSFATEDNFKS